MYTGKAALLESGIAESNSCLDLTDVFTSSPIGKIQPSGYGVGKLVAMKPLVGGFDLSVVRGTTATRYNSSSLIEDVALNVPRLDYFGVTCPSILVETQATNVVKYSEDFSQNFWANPRSEMDVASDSIASPMVGKSADKFTPTTANAEHTQPKNFVGLVDGGVACWSAFFKDNGYDIQVLLRAGAFSERISFEADLTAGTVTAVTTYGSATGTASIIAYPNGWYRVVGTIDYAAGVTGITAQFSAWNGSTTTFAGDGTSGFYVIGNQIEDAALSSYIPTLAGSTVTRNADVMSVTGLSGITTLTETFEDDTTNIISTPTSYTMSEGRIKKVTTV
tara:strand:- start:189 stop:1193 length:1005 start_codon:yes stop_codon:yes gene_type:complete